VGRLIAALPNSGQPTAYHEHVNASLKRRLRWAAIGFLIAFTFITVVVLADGLETRHFEALNQSARPATWRGWLDFALLSLDAYIVAGIVGALIGFVGSFTRPDKKRSAGWLLIAFGVAMATISIGGLPGNFLEFLDSGEGMSPPTRGEMIPEYLLDFLLIVGGARLVWMGHKPKAAQ
jgi:cytochrome c biogenesis protein CcdA